VSSEVDRVAAPRSESDVGHILADLADGLKEAIPNQLVGLYLQGSFALGEADEHSDVDFVVAVRWPLDDRAVARLQVMHGHLHDHHDAWARHLEGSYFPLEVLRDCERRDERLWYLDNGARQLIRSSHCNTAVVRQIVREHGVVITGPDPEDLIESIPASLLRTEIRVSMRTFGAEILADPTRFANRFYQGFIVLHFCRMWCDLESGSVGSKRRGAAWVKERAGRPWDSLIDGAWATRPDPARSVRTPADPADFEHTLEFVRLVLARFEND
jgi:hypothetical protein